MKRKILTVILLTLAAMLIFSACNGAKFELHKVTFDADGGTLNWGDKSTTVQTYGNVDLPTPVKEGHVFLGWYIGEGANEAQFTATTMVTSDITLKAKWAKAEYTVTFLDYYGNIVKRDTVKYMEGASAPTVPRIDEACLRFDTWDKDISCVMSDMEVRALYVLDSYTITYVTNSSQTIPPTSYLFDETPATPPTPGLDGHYFIGWYLDAAFTEEYTFDEPLTQNITLYAYFNEAFPISTIDELLAIEPSATKSYFLKNDIDCEGKVLSSSITDFAGTLDGEGHKIHNFAFHPASAASTGLFTTNKGTIKNITFDNFSYALNQYNVNANAGFLVGSNSGTIENIHIKNASLSYTASTDGSGNYTFHFGGIAGSSSGIVKDCSVTATALYSEAWTRSAECCSTKVYLYSSPVVGISSGEIIACTSSTEVTLYHNAGTYDSWASSNITDTRFGGIASINNGKISGCKAKVTVTASSNGYRTTESLIGGLVYGNNSEIESCSADVKITLNGTFSYISAGGFVENNAGTVKNCYAKAEISNVNSNSLLGGFASCNTGGIYKCYAVGTINAGAATSGKGGFAGYNNGSVNSCFASVDISATDASAYGPFVGKTDTASFITNCYYKNNAIFTTNGVTQTFTEAYSEGITHLSLTDAAFLKDTLGWSEEIWTFDESKMKYPTLK